MHICARGLARALQINHETAWKVLQRQEAAE